MKVHEQGSRIFSQNLLKQNMNVTFQDAWDACNWKWNLCNEREGGSEGDKTIFISSRQVERTFDQGKT